MCSQSGMLETRWNDALPINGIQKMHIFEPVPKSGILCTRRFATNTPPVKFQVTQPVQESPHMHPEPEPELPVMSVDVGEWVLAKYDDGLYPGEVRELGDREVKVSVMVKSGKLYKWPTSEDCIFYPIRNIIMKLQPPTLKSARGTFEFREKW